MNSKSMKNILIIAGSLIGIMLVSTLIVIVVNSFIGLSTDTNNVDVATSISALAFGIAVMWKYLYDRDNTENE